MATPPTGPGLSSPQLIIQENLPAQEPLYPLFSAAEQSYAQYQQNFPLVQPFTHQPTLFRRFGRESEQYQVPPKNVESILEPTAYGNLKILLIQCLGGFNPTQINQNPIHNELFSLRQGVLTFCETMPLHHRIPYLETFISEVVIAGISATPGKEVEAELLEIALRNHLYRGLQEQVKADLAHFFSVNGKFPLDIAQTEAALYCFVTKNDFYNFPPSASQFLLDEKILQLISKNAQLATIALPLDKAISTSEGIVADLLNQYQLTQPSLCAFTVEAMIREQLATRMITALAGQFRTAFQTTGVIDPLEFEANIGTLKNFFQKCEPRFNIELRLIVETLDLPHDQANPFQSVRERAEKAPKPQKGALASFASRLKTVVQRSPTQTLLEKQLGTIGSMELRWKGITLPREQPSAPPMEESLPAPQTYKIDDKDIPVISYASLAFEGKAFKDLPRIVRRDILNHIFYHPEIKGKVEEATRAYFNGDGREIFKELRAMNELKLPETGLPEGFVKAGEEILAIYYSLNYLDKKQDFLNKFQQLPKVGLFYQYVYEMAKAANIDFEKLDEDHRFAENHWERIIPLSVQALERCLHTVKQ